MSEYNPDRAYDDWAKSVTAEDFAFTATWATVIGALVATFLYAVAAVHGWAPLLFGVAGLGAIILGVVGVYRFWFWVYLQRGEQ